MKFDRVLGILVSLLSRERVTAQDLADRWEVSVRTVYRDLRSLEEAGIPLASAPGPGGGIDLVEGFTLDRHLLRPEELDRLRGALAGLARVFPDPSVQSGQRKLEGLAGGLAESEVVYLDLDAWSSPDGSGELARLVDACRTGRVCRVAYRDGQGDQTERVIEPQTLVWRGRWYLFAWCRLRNDFRLFRVAALSDLRPTPERTARRPQTYATTIKAAEREASRVAVTVRFSAAKAHLAPRPPRARDVEEEADGRVRVTLDLRPEDAFDTCARWGADLEVLAPESLRDQFRRLAEGLHGIYFATGKIPDRQLSPARSSMDPRREPMEKLDLAKTDKAYYAPPTHPIEVNFGPLPYLAISGRGAPLGAEYAQALEALFTLAYAVKFASKAIDRDFTVAKLEGQWWWPDEWAGKGPDEVPRDVWEWTLRLRLPSFVDADVVERARVLKQQGSNTPRRMDDVRWELWDEGPCVQILHVGPYATEPTTLVHVHDYMTTHGLVEAGLHHEIYLTDPRKGDPAKARTVLRLPVKPARL